MPPVHLVVNDTSMGNKSVVRHRTKHEYSGSQAKLNINSIDYNHQLYMKILASRSGARNWRRFPVGARHTT